MDRIEGICHGFKVLIISNHPHLENGASIGAKLSTTGSEGLVGRGWLVAGRRR